MIMVLLLQALLEQQLAVERGKMETEKKKLQHAMDEKVEVSFVVPINSSLRKKWLSYFSSCIWLFHYLKNTQTTRYRPVLICFLNPAKIVDLNLVMFDAFDKNLFALTKNIFYLYLYFHYCKEFQQNLPSFLRRECYFDNQVCLEHLPHLLLERNFHRFGKDITYSQLTVVLPTVIRLTALQFLETFTWTVTPFLYIPCSHGEELAIWLLFSLVVGTFPLAGVQFISEPCGYFVQLRILLFCHKGGKTFVCRCNLVVRAEFASIVLWSWFS